MTAGWAASVITVFPEVPGPRPLARRAGAADGVWTLATIKPRDSRPIATAASTTCRSAARRHGDRPDVVAHAIMAAAQAAPERPRLYVTPRRRLPRRASGSLPKAPELWSYAAASRGSISGSSRREARRSQPRRHLALGRRARCDRVIDACGSCCQAWSARRHRCAKRALPASCWSTRSSPAHKSRRSGCAGRAAVRPSRRMRAWPAPGGARRPIAASGSLGAPCGVDDEPGRRTAARRTASEVVMSVIQGLEQDRSRNSPTAAASGIRARRHHPRQRRGGRGTASASRRSKGSASRASRGINSAFTVRKIGYRRRRWRGRADPVRRACYQA